MSDTEKPKGTLGSPEDERSGSEVADILFDTLVHYYYPRPSASIGIAWIPGVLGKVNRPTMFFYLAVATSTAKISLGRNVSIFMKPYKNAINRAINTSFVSVCILICISLKLPDNNHVKV